METELNRLIEKIKADGVGEAQREAGSIIKEAEAKARKIVEEAERKRDAIVSEGRREAKNFMASSEKALKQSARDVLLTLRERVTEFFGRIVKEKTAEAFTGDLVGKVIKKAAENLGREGALDIEIVVNDKDKAKLEKALFGALGKEAKAALTVKGSKAVKKGFRIGKKAKESYLDFTDEAIAEAFTRYLNPKLVEKLDINLGLGKDDE
jgi:V/A-type H+-transporting ATPase subunit E